MGGRIIIMAGFTLLEVLVALAVTAIGLGALWMSMSHEITVTRNLPDRIIAGWVAQNRIVQRQVQDQWPDPRTYSGSEEMGGRKWYWQEQISSTDEPLLRRITVSVGSDPLSLSLFSLEGYLQRPRPPAKLPKITFKTGTGADG